MSKMNGDVSFVAKDGKTYTLRLDFNALCDFGEKTGKNALEHFSQTDPSAPPKIPDPSDMRALFWAALREHHPDVDLRGAGRLFDQDAMTRAMVAMSPASGGDGAGNGAAVGQ